MEDFSLDSFFGQASTLGFSYLDKTYINKPEPEKVTETARTYERVTQKTSPTPTTVSSILDNKMLVYGGIGLLGVVVLFALKGK